jgi:methylated-DNA-[protein]-cysteine S-methyltransferase
MTPAFADLRGMAQSRIATPVGPMTALLTERGLAGLWFDAQAHHPGAIDAPVDDDHAHALAARQWLDVYWRGAATDAIEVPLDLQGTAFQRDVWQALLRIGRGRTRTYGEIAAAVGQAGSARAVGAAIGRNPVSVIVPCHRVVGASGSLTGYAGGLPRKLALLQHEGVLLT